MTNPTAVRRIRRHLTFGTVLLASVAATPVACSDFGSPSPRTLLELFVTPVNTSVAPSGTVQLAISGAWSDGASLIPATTFQATGGTISEFGLYTAGSTPGQYHVIASAVGSELRDTATITIEENPPSLTGIVISPAATSLPVGGSVQFSAKGIWSNGDSTAPVVTYSATGGTISPSGFFTAGAAVGSFQVIAYQFGGSIADTSTVTIENLPAATPVLFEDFSTYTSTANFHSDPRNIYANEEFGGPWGQWNLITLDSTTGVGEIGIGNSTKSMKYTWYNRTNATGVQPDADRCKDFYILKQINVTPVTEMWAEFYVKFSTNFTSKAPSSWSCTSNADYKFIFLTTQPGSRFSLKNDYAGLGTRWDPTAPGQGDGDNNFVHNVFHDNQWHRLRVHAKLATGGMANGEHRVWLDDVLVYTKIGITTGNQTAIYALKLGNNMNQGPDRTQTLHWGLIRVYTTNPGW